MIIFYPLKSIEELSHKWIRVPPNQYGEKFWDKNNIHRNQDGWLRIFSKFIPNINNKITPAILYKVDINYIEKTFKDFAVGSKDFMSIKY